MQEDDGRLPSGHRATAVEPVPVSPLRDGIPSADLLRFSDRDKVFAAIFDPGVVVGPRLSTQGCYEHMDHWRARAAIDVMLTLAVESRSFAQAIEARRAETLGSVHESTVPNGDAPNSNPSPGYTQTKEQP